MKWKSAYDLCEEDKCIKLVNRDELAPLVEVDYDDIDDRTSVSYVSHAVVLAYAPNLYDALRKVDPTHPLIAEILERMEHEVARFAYE